MRGEMRVLELKYYDHKDQVLSYVSTLKHSQMVRLAGAVLFLAAFFTCNISPFVPRYNVS
jgi:hypothetical protein